ncbi:MAG TPA: hypothetical protein DCQ51_04320 [Planktothrix sp. UBA8407]|jgi:hypothetical protein|nr:hypothetical protein [Planktothrix sp. UBA8407]
MQNENLDKLYKDVFEKLSDQITNKDEGVLYQIIILVAPKRSNEICNAKGIKNNASLDDDLKINPSERQGWEILKTDVKDILNLFQKSIDRKRNMNPDQAKFEDIVTIACELVGETTCREYLDKSANLNTNTRQPSPSTLCIVVPALVVENIRENDLISAYDVEKIIDNSLYFLCTSPEDANFIQQHLELTDEDITTVSEQREIYVKININDGEEMIGKKVPYSLKRNLPSNGQLMVEKLACLKYLSVSGLENFNRF